MKDTTPRRRPRHQRWKTWTIHVLSVVIGLQMGFLILNAAWPLPPEPTYSTIVTDRDGRVVHAFLTPDDMWRMYTTLEEISPDLRRAIVAKEDARFDLHPGIDPLAIARALVRNALTGRRTSGASTITMQVARLLERRPRTYGAKLVEMVRALQLEMRYSKDEILQLYLNLVPYGGNIEGVKSAALLYFGRSPNHLSPAQITALSIIPNRPAAWTPGRHDADLRTARDQWLHVLHERGIWSDEVLADALIEELGAVRRNAPSHIPHLATRLFFAHREDRIIPSTIDMEHQTTARALVADHVSGLRSIGVTNACALVVDNAEHEVVAYVGSADFFDDAAAGQVDGTRGLRQPGSTLKPIIYGLAFDHGLLTPARVLADVPVVFDGYAPVNYDQRFHGAVTVEDALRTSLNIPAVRTLHDLGLEPVIDVLARADLGWVDEHRDQLGLSLALGGCGVTLEELTGLYAALADGGRFHPLRYRTDASPGRSDSILSPAAAWMVTDILTRLDRPDLPIGWESADGVPRIAWKTGTSYGRKDAWSIGYNERYTIGVWCGNFSGRGVPELTGAASATPLLFRLFEAIDPRASETDWARRPGDVSFRRVCSRTGRLPGPHCAETVIDAFIPLVSSTAACDLLRPVDIAPDSSVSYCAACRPDAGYRTALYEAHPPEMLAYFHAAGMDRTTIPPHDPDCLALHPGQAPTITHPLEGTEYLIDRWRDTPLELRCQAGAEVDTVHWYLNDRHVGSTNCDGSLFIHPPTGPNTLSCTDDRGRSTTIAFDVVRGRL